MTVLSRHMVRVVVVVLPMIAMQVACVGSCDMLRDERRLVGSYSLRRVELTSFYLESSTHEATGAGVVGGEVEEIAWTDELIAVRLRALPGAQSPSWMVVHVHDGVLRGPYDQAAWEGVRERTPALRSLVLRPVQETWDGLGGR